MDHVWRNDGNRGRAARECRALEAALLLRVRVWLQIPEEVDIPAHARLMDLLTASPIGASSLDLVEAFVKAIADMEGDLDAELPAFTAGDQIGAICHKIAQRALAPAGIREASEA